MTFSILPKCFLKNSYCAKVEMETLQSNKFWFSEYSHPLADRRLTRSSNSGKCLSLNLQLEREDRFHFSELVSNVYFLFSTAIRSINIWNYTLISLVASLQTSRWKQIILFFFGDILKVHLKVAWRLDRNIITAWAMQLPTLGWYIATIDLNDTV